MRHPLEPPRSCCQPCSIVQIPSDAISKLLKEPAFSLRSHLCTDNIVLSISLQRNPGACHRFNSLRERQLVTLAPQYKPQVQTVRITNVLGGRYALQYLFYDGGQPEIVTTGAIEWNASPLAALQQLEGFPAIFEVDQVQQCFEGSLCCVWLNLCSAQALCQISRTVRALVSANCLGSTCGCCHWCS